MKSQIIKKPDDTSKSYALTLPETSALIQKHAPMLAMLQERMPAIIEQTAVYQRRQSQFMDGILTINQPTPIRRLRQILSEINRSIEAFRAAEYRLKKQQVKRRIYLRDAEIEKDSLKAELLYLKADNTQTLIQSALPVVAAAVRKVTALIEQHDSIMISMGKEPTDHITEEEYEKQEEEYHIKTAFTQALTAARSRGGGIDEGNHIYLQQLGINGAHEQYEIQMFLTKEAKTFADQKIPKYNMVTSFLEDMYQKFKGCSTQIQEYKGMLDRSNFALLEGKENADS